ncbi:Protein CMS1 [Exophiala dermatitidis]
MGEHKQKPSKPAGTKRKLENAPDADANPEPSPKRAQPQPQPKSAARQEQIEVDDTIAMMDPALLADHFAKYVRKSFPDSSAIELDDQLLPSKAFLNTTDFDKPHEAANLPAFLEKFSKEGKSGLSSCDDKGSPHTLVVTSSGIRTADLYRELRVFNSDNTKVAKLIAKHMKLKDNVEYMQKTRVGIAIGTPGRLKDLIDAGALKTRGIRRIVVDGSYRDQKKRTIFEMDELFRPLLTLLNSDEIRPRYVAADDRIELLVF